VETVLLAASDDKIGLLLADYCYRNALHTRGHASQLLLISVQHIYLGSF
jgi:hypothetical protein